MSRPEPRREQPKLVLGRGVALACLVAGACASSTPGGGFDVDGGGGGGVDASGSELDATSSAIDASGPGSTDATPAGPTVLYVATNGADFYPGTDPLQPIRHLAIAVPRAAGCMPAPCELRIAVGTYDEAITLVPGVDLLGGYAPDFSDRDPIAYPTILMADADRVVVANGLNATTTIEGLTIRGADFEDRNDGSVTVALWVRDSGEFLRLSRVVVEGGRAGRGVAGDDGTLLSCSTSGGPGGTAVNCSSTAGGGGNAGSDPAFGGGGGGGGGSNCPSACPLVGSDGISGGTGGDNGLNGASGDPGERASDGDGSFVGDTWLGAAGAPGGRGLHGTGGGGGGSGGTKRFVACFGCGTLLGGRGGDGAPGGCGGTGGTSGGSGGAAFAIVVLRSTITVDYLTVKGGIGGRGGDGGDGHPGGPGGTDGTVGREGQKSQQCGAINYKSGAGAAGGIGGHGGHGGGGPGGLGGPAIGVALVGGATIVEGEPGTFDVILGVAGQGGAAGTGAVAASSGLAGAAAATVTY